MKTSSAATNRRRFLHTSLWGAALTATVPAFLSRTVSSLRAETPPGARPSTGQPVLVVLQLAGGNDGLNTVVPFLNDHYYRARPRLAVSRAAALKLNDGIGLHPALAGLKELYDAANLCVIQGVGYPNPNRSHFRSTEIWQTASDANKVERRGWIGRYFDHACPGADPAVGVSYGRQAPQAFASSKPAGITLEAPENYRFAAGGGEAAASESFFRQLNGGDTNSAPEMLEANSGGSIGAMHGTITHGGSVLDYLERTALDAQSSSDQILAISRKSSNTLSYPESALGRSLSLTARLIGGGLPTRVFYVSQGGYDTHVNQQGAHERLLRDLGDSLRAFATDLKGMGQFERVLVMTFSEFGRRVGENASGGTDHGAAAPLFLVGPRVKAGLFGRHPSLAPADLVNGDTRFGLDFRSVYAALLERWLRTRSAPVLGKQFPVLECV